MLICMLPQAIKPIVQLLKALSIGQIENQQSAHCRPVVPGRDRSVALRATGIPNLCFHYYTILQDDFLREEFHSDCGWDAREYPLMVTLQDIGLSYTHLSAEYN